MKSLFVFLSLLLLASTESHILPEAGAAEVTGEEIAFVERYALAADRAKALEELIPGTEEFYYWHALHFQQAGNDAKFAETIDQWAKRHRSSGTRDRLLDRQAFLDYEQDPKKALERIRSRIGVNFNHSRENKSSKPDFPTGLDQGLISWNAFLADSRRRSSTLDRVQNPGLNAILAEEALALKLEDRELRDLLSRVQRPDHAVLVKLLDRELKMKESKGFGGLNIHWQLTSAQLDALLKLRADLKHNDHFVQARLRRLLPDADKNLERQPEVRAAYLEAGWKYVSDLPPAFNSLKAHFLFLLLEHKSEVDGEYSKDLFLTYLKLPRNCRVINPKYFEANPDLRRWQADLNAQFPRGCITPPVTIPRDEQLIRDYLSHYFLKEDSYAAYQPYLLESWLKPLLAEVKIVNGLGDPEKWASLISPSQYQNLRERVDIEFASSNAEHFAVADKVELSVDLKNVEKLIVKVYEINALGYYLAESLEVGTDLELDGLVANDEKTYEYKVPALRRHRETFSFPEIDARRGIWIVEFIGNSRSSRALIRKGQLSHVVRPSGAGSALWVLDEDGEIVKDAAIWTQGRKYTASAKKQREGMILLPFASGGRQPIVLAAGPDDGAFATLSSYNAPTENYGFEAKFHVEREDLLRRNKARVVVRPQLMAGGMPTSFKLIEDSVLHVTATDLDGVASTDVIPNFKLYSDRDSVHEFTVPERLGSLVFRVDATVKGLDGATRNLRAGSNAITINQIDRGEQVKDLQLSRNEAGGFFLEVLGRNGEPIIDQAVSCHFVHLDFRDQLQASLKSDERGRVHLGALAGLHSLRASGAGITEKVFALPRAVNTYPSSLHGVVGEELRVPYAGTAAKPSLAEVSLLEVRGGVFSTDHFNKLSIEKGFLVLKGLAAGDYSLQLEAPNRHHLQIRVTEEESRVGAIALGAIRSLELLHQNPVQIVSLEANQRSLVIELGNANPLTRVHVIATRYEPRFRIENDLIGIRGIEPLVGSPAYRPSLYLSGRKIGDEYRYIIDRRYAAKFPGVMAPRPGLLLNPWALRDTDAGSQLARDGEEWNRAQPGADASGGRAKAKKQAGASSHRAFGNLDYLRNDSIEFFNLVPDDKGRIRIPRNDLGDRHLIHVVATDPGSLVYRTLTLPEPEQVEYRDLRLHTGFDPARKFTQQKQVTVMQKGRKLQIEDLLSSRFEAYDSLGSVYGLFRGLSSDPKLEEFSFLLGWPELEIEEKRRLYSRHACHELSFFLSLRDPDFFREVITPYLANKKDKTFLDHYLLVDDLEAFVEPWRYAQLNVVERALLARRVEGDQARTARHLKDLQALLPPDRSNQAHLFEWAIQSSGLGGGGGDRFGFNDAKDAAKSARGEKAQVIDELRAVEAKLDGAIAFSAMQGRKSALSKGEALGSADDAFAAPRCSCSLLR